MDGKCFSHENLSNRLGLSASISMSKRLRTIDIIISHEPSRDFRSSFRLQDAFFSSEVLCIEFQTLETKIFNKTNANRIENHVEANEKSQILSSKHRKFSFIS